MHDIRDQSCAMELDSLKSEVSQFSFSNKGLFLTVTWRDQKIVRVFSLHKKCSWIDIEHEAPVNSIDFDLHGGYLMTTSANTVRIYYYRKWQCCSMIKPFDGEVSNARWTDSCRKIYLTGNNQNVKVYSL